MASPLWPWNPTRILREVQAFPTNSSVVRVETDIGEGYLKALGNNSGPHSLACELVGTMLASRLGLRTLNYGLIAVTEEFQPALGNGKLAEVGTAFITRAEEGTPWSGKPDDLNLLTNTEDVAKLIVFDTWTQNCDRYLPREGQKSRRNLGNVFLSREETGSQRFTLKAIDQGCCFTCDRELSPKNLSSPLDDQIYGFFPGFRGHARRETALRVVDRLESITRSEVEDVVSSVPGDWDVGDGSRRAWVDWILARRHRVRSIIERDIRPVDLLDGVQDQEGQP